jgi:hypothetical protein
MSKVISPNLVPLSSLATEITALTGDPCPKTYAQLWKLVVDGVLPAEKISNRYWVDVRVAAALVGVTVAA